MKQTPKKERRIRRHRKVRARVYGTGERPRFSVFRSSRFLYAQLIDDTIGKTLFGVSDKSITGKNTKSERALKLGKRVGERAKELGITHAVFDRGGFRYQGRITKIVEGARAGGLQF